METQEQIPENVVADIARLQEQVKALEKAVDTLSLNLRAEFNFKHLQNREDIKSIKLSLAKAIKQLNSLELKIARYAGGAGVLTAIAIKLLDKLIH